MNPTQDEGSHAQNQVVHITSFFTTTHCKILPNKNLG